MTSMTSFGVFIVNFENISHLFLVSLLLVADSEQVNVSESFLTLPVFGHIHKEHLRNI